MRGGTSSCWTCVAPSISVVVTFWIATRSYGYERVLTVLVDVVVLEVVFGQVFVFDHAELESFDNVSGVIELIVSNEDLLQGLGDGRTHEDASDAHVAQQVTSQVDLLEGRAGVNQNFEERLRRLVVDRTVAERERLKDRVDGQALRKMIDALGSKLVVVEFEDQDRGCHRRVQHSGEELATEFGDLVVKKFEDLDLRLLNFEELADGSHALVLNVGLPEADGRAVWVPNTD
jgi:hypothetical protein